MAATLTGAATPVTNIDNTIGWIAEQGGPYRAVFRPEFRASLKTLHRLQVEISMGNTACTARYLRRLEAHLIKLDWHAKHADRNARLLARWVDRTETRNGRHPAVAAHMGWAP